MAITQILQKNDSSRITLFGNEVWLHDKINLSLIHPYQVVLGKTSFDNVINAEADKLIYKIDHLMLDHADWDWKDTYLKLFFKDEQRSKTVILMAQINDYVLYNIGYELK